MKRKKVFSVILVFLLVLSCFCFSACDSDEDSDRPGKSSSRNTGADQLFPGGGDNGGGSGDSGAEYGQPSAWTCDWCGKTCTGDAYYAKSYSDTLCEECAADYLQPIGANNHKKDQDTTSGPEWVCDWCGNTCRGSRYYAGNYSETLCVYCASSYWCPFPVKDYIKN